MVKKAVIKIFTSYKSIYIYLKCSTLNSCGNSDRTPRSSLNVPNMEGYTAREAFSISICPWSLFSSKCRIINVANVKGQKAIFHRGKNYHILTKFLPNLF